MSTSASVAVARVMAHCGGSPEAALAHVAAAIREKPGDSEPYAVIAELRRQWPAEVAAAVAAPVRPGQFVAGAYLCFLDGDSDRAALLLGSLTGYRPDVAWASAPWFTGERFLATVSVTGLADAAVTITDYGSDLDNDAVRENLAPWLRAVEVVGAREPVAAQLARLAILLRFCGRTGESFALCDRADAVERVMLTEVVRAGTWGYLGDAREQAAALRRALLLEPGNWSLYLDLADLAARDDDFGAAAGLVEQGLRYESEDVTLRAAGAAYRLLAGGPLAERDLLLELAPALPHAGYRDGLIELADREARAREQAAS